MLRASLTALLVLCSACGSNRPELPGGLSEPVSCAEPDYPGGPYGSEPGSTVENVCFRGARDPAVGLPGLEQDLEAISLADYYTGQRPTARLILLNTSAVWCSACRIEHETLSEHARQYRDRGLVVLSALFQAQDRSPATFDDLKTWVKVFDTDFPIVLDPSYALGRYASAETAPLNLVIDAASMKILDKYIGDQAAVMWPRIAQRLGTEP